MPIFHKNKEITSVNYGSRAVNAIYDGARLIWEAVRSCFGKGFWINKHPWENKDAWKNKF